MNTKVSFVLLFVCFLFIFVIEESYCLRANNIKSKDYDNSKIINTIYPKNNISPILIMTKQNVTKNDSTNYNKNTTSRYLENCNESTCKNGKCQTKTFCVCNKNYANSDKNTSACIYERKKQSIAFLLELITPVGIGHLYIGYLLYGLIKFSLLIIFPLFNLYLLCHFVPLSHPDDKTDKLCGIILTLIYITCFLSWMIFDLINFGRNIINDSNDIELEPW